MKHEGVPSPDQQPVIDPQLMEGLRGAKNSDEAEDRGYAWLNETVRNLVNPGPEQAADTLCTLVCAYAQAGFHHLASRTLAKFILDFNTRARNKLPAEISEAIIARVERALIYIDHMSSQDPMSDIEKTMGNIDDGIVKPKIQPKDK